MEREGDGRETGGPGAPMASTAGTAADASRASGAGEPSPRDVSGGRDGIADAADRARHAGPPAPDGDPRDGAAPVGSATRSPACGCAARAAAPAPSPPARAALGLIRLYGLVLSPLLGRNCRYLPTCSAYGDEAIRRHGVWYGGFMTLARLCRCHPLGASGFDPVPETLPDGIRWWTPWRAGRWGAGHIDPATRLDKP